MKYDDLVDAFYSHFLMSRMELTLTWVIFFLTCNISRAAICIENGIEVCCSGYILNTTSGHCVKCPPGYTGMNCTYKCHYPTYGEDCFMMCVCSAEMCDSRSGCSYISTAVNPSTPYMGKSQAPTTLGVQRTFSMEQSSEGSTFGQTSPSNISMHYGKVVFYVTVALLSVCMISLLMYGISYLRKMNTSKHRIKTLDHQFKNTGNSLYECVDFPHHI